MDGWKNEEAEVLSVITGASAVAGYQHFHQIDLHPWQEQQQQQQANVEWISLQTSMPYHPDPDAKAWNMYVHRYTIPGTFSLRRLNGCAAVFRVLHCAREGVLQ